MAAIIPIALRVFGRNATAVCQAARINIIDPLVNGTALPTIRLFESKTWGSLTLLEALSVKEADGSGDSLMADAEELPAHQSLTDLNLEDIEDEPVVGLKGRRGVLALT